MKWRTATIREIAPAKAATIRFSPDDVIWHLTLDQIESNTGNVINKKVAPASEAGTSSYVFDDGNVLYSKLRPYLNKVICPSEPGMATTELIPLRPRPGLLDRRLLTYYLRSTHFLTFANVAVAGVKMPRIIMQKFWEHQVPLPPLSEQQRIVEILDQADALRKKRAEADAKAARILPALFYKMFGDPATNPKGWDTVRLAKHCDIVTGNTPSTEITDYYGGGFPWARPADLNDQMLVVRTEKTLSKEGKKVSRVVPAHSVLVVCIGATLGKVAMAGTEMAVNQQINAVLPNTVLIPEFLYVQCTLLADRLKASATKSTLPILNKAQFGQQEFLKPSTESQESFCRAARQVVMLSTPRKSAARTLDTIFVLLLHRAFTGDLTAKWREAHMKELLAEMDGQKRQLEVTL